jgi:glycyl-tRNA synthetase
VSEEQQQAVLDFIKERLRNLFLEQGFRYDVIDALLAEQGQSPARALQGIRELSNWVTSPNWDTVLPAYARCVRITRDLTERFPVDPELLIDPAEQALYQGLVRAEEEIFPLTPVSSNFETRYSVDALLGAFVPLIPAINNFFEEVLVMVEDERLRHNRLGLLQRIAALARDKVDLSKLEGF